MLCYVTHTVSLGYLWCDGFFDRASVCSPAKSVAELTFSLAYILNVAFVVLYHINEIGRRAGDVMSYTFCSLATEKKCKTFVPL